MDASQQSGLQAGSRDRVWTALWVPVLVLAHAFAGYWLLKAYFTLRPNFGKKLRQRLRTFLCCNTASTPDQHETPGHAATGEVKTYPGLTPHWVSKQLNAISSCCYSVGSGVMIIKANIRITLAVQHYESTCSCKSVSSRQSATLPTRLPNKGASKYG